MTIFKYTSRYILKSLYTFAAIINQMKNIFLKMSIHAWDVQVTRTEKLLDQLPNEALLREIAPGKNSGIYVLGHLIAVNDAISTILGTGKATYPELYATFVQNPDNAGLNKPAADELRLYWKQVHERLNAEFLSMDEDSWLARHNSMTDDDFLKDPSRNKLSVLLGRTGHLAYHLGQLRLLL